MKETKGATKLQRIVPASWKTLVRVMGLDVANGKEHDRKGQKRERNYESDRRQSATERKEEEKIVLSSISQKRVTTKEITMERDGRGRWSHEFESTIKVCH